VCVNGRWCRTLSFVRVRTHDVLSKYSRICTHPRLDELVRHTTSVCEDDLPVADDKKQEECVETKEQNDARGLENKRSVISS